NRPPLSRCRSSRPTWPPSPSAPSASASSPSGTIGPTSPSAGRTDETAGRSGRIGPRRLLLQEHAERPLELIDHEAPFLGRQRDALLGAQARALLPAHHLDDHCRPAVPQVAEHGCTTFGGDLQQALAFGPLGVEPRQRWMAC